MGNLLQDVTLVIYNLVCLTGTFSDHEGRTSMTTMTKTVIRSSVSFDRTSR